MTAYLREIKTYEVYCYECANTVKFNSRGEARAFQIAHNKVHNPYVDDERGYCYTVPGAMDGRTVHARGCPRYGDSWLGIGSQCVEWRESK